MGSYNNCVVTHANTVVIAVNRVRMPADSVGNYRNSVVMRANTFVIAFYLIRMPADSIGNYHNSVVLPVNRVVRHANVICRHHNTMHTDHGNLVMHHGSVVSRHRRMGAQRGSVDSRDTRSCMHHEGVVSDRGKVAADVSISQGFPERLACLGRSGVGGGHASSRRLSRHSALRNTSRLPSLPVAFTSQ